MYRGLEALHHLLLKIRCFHRTSAGTGWSFYPGPSWTLLGPQEKNPVPASYDCYDWRPPAMEALEKLYGIIRDAVGIGLMLV